MSVSVVYTYDQTTPESAADGEHSESGFYSYGGNRFPATDPTAGEPECMRLSDAARDIRDTVGCIDSIELFETCGDGWKLRVYGSSDCIDYGTCTEESIAAHVTGHVRLLRALKRALEARS